MTDRGAGGENLGSTELQRTTAKDELGLGQPGRLCALPAVKAGLSPAGAPHLFQNPASSSHPQFSQLGPQLSPGSGSSDPH